MFYTHKRSLLSKERGLLFSCENEFANWQILLEPVRVEDAVEFQTNVRRFLEVAGKEAVAKLAANMEVGIGTIGRWASGIAVPHKLVQAEICRNMSELSGQ